MKKILYILIILLTLPATIFAANDAGWDYHNGISNTTYSSTSPNFVNITTASTTATSTFANGINLSNKGCFAINNVCINGGSSGTLTGNGIAGTMSAWNSISNLISTSTIIGNQFIATSTTATSTFAGGITGPNNFVIDQTTGFVGIGTSTPENGGDKLSVWASATSPFTRMTLNNNTSNGGTSFRYYNGNLQGAALVYNNTDGQFQINGMSTNSYLTFGTAGTERMRLSNAGLFGIGTSTPGTTLSVSGDSVLAGVVTSQRYIATSSTASSNFPFASTTAISATNICISTDCRTAWPSGGGVGSYPFTPNTNFGVAAQATTGIAWFQNGLNASSTSHFDYASTTQLTVNDKTFLLGNVGIGTTSPNSTLSVRGSGGISTGAGMGAAQFGLSVATGGTNQGVELGVVTLGGTNYAMIQGMSFANNNGQNLAINPFGTGNIITNITGGNLGIGTTTPGTPLSVTGNGVLTGRLTVSSLVATSTTATSTFFGNLMIGNALCNGTLCDSGGIFNAIPTANQTSFLSNDLSSTITTGNTSVGAYAADCHSQYNASSSPHQAISDTNYSAQCFTGPNFNSANALEGGLFAGQVIPGLPANSYVEVVQPGAMLFGALGTDVTKAFMTWSIGGGYAMGNYDMTLKNVDTFLGPNDANGGLGLGSTTPFARLSLSASSTASFDYMDVGSTTNGLSGANSSIFTIKNNGRIGIGTSSPFANFAINPIAGSAPNQFVIGSSTATNFIVANNGSVGLGTSTPAAVLAIQGKANTFGTLPASVLLVRGTSDGNSAGETVDIKAGGAAKTIISSGAGSTSGGNSGSLDLIGSDSIGSAAGGTINIRGGSATGASSVSLGGPINISPGLGTSGAAGFTGLNTYQPINMVVAGGNVNIGTSTSLYKLTVASTTAPQLSLSAGIGIPQWVFGNEGGNLYFATTTTASDATSTISAFTIKNDGNVGIGTSTPSANLSVTNTNTVGTTTIMLGVKGCFAMADADGTGFTYIIANNGTLSASVTPCN